MSGLTTRFAIPYMTETDPMASVDDLSQDQAEWLDLLQGEHGDYAMSVFGPDGTNTYAINYARDYSVLPSGLAVRVTSLTMLGGGGNVYVQHWVTGETSTGFQLNYRSGVGTNRTIRWVARPVKV